jgi:sec-independent protein translocase protein TatA
MLAANTEAATDRGHFPRGQGVNCRAAPAVNKGACWPPTLLGVRLAFQSGALKMMARRRQTGSRRMEKRMGLAMSPLQLLIILVIVALIFGTKKLKDVGGDLGSAVKSFRKAMNTANEVSDETVDPPKQLTSSDEKEKTK